MCLHAPIPSACTDCETHMHQIAMALPAAFLTAGLIRAPLAMQARRWPITGCTACHTSLRDEDQPVEVLYACS